MKKISVNSINLVLWKANNSWWNTHSEQEQGYIRYLAQRVYDYLNPPHRIRRRKKMPKPKRRKKVLEGYGNKWAKGIVFAKLYSFYPEQLVVPSIFKIPIGTCTKKVRITIEED